MGAKSGPKGSAFERKIAILMREIYDPPELTAELADLQKLASKAAKGKKGPLLAARRELQKSSAVRRSDQGKGAVEPDVVIRDGLCPCWLECQDAKGDKHRPLEKYRQAVRDVAETGSPLWPVAIGHKTGDVKIGVWIGLHHLVLLADMQPGVGRDSRPGPLNRWSKGFELAQPVRLDLQDFLMLLRDDNDRRNLQSPKYDMLQRQNNALVRSQ